MWSPTWPSGGLQQRCDPGRSAGQPQSRTPTCLMRCSGSRVFSSGIPVIGASQLRPRTVSRAASTPHCSSGVRWPARSPSR